MLPYFSTRLFRNFTSGISFPLNLASSSSSFPLPPLKKRKFPVINRKSRIKMLERNPSVAALQEERKQTLSKASNIEPFPFSFPSVKTVDYRLSTCLFTRPSECRFSDDSSEINFSKSKRKDSRTGEYDWKGRNTGKEGVSCNSSVFSSAKPNKLTS